MQSKMHKNRLYTTVKILSTIFCGSVENPKNQQKAVENCVESVDNCP